MVSAAAPLFYLDVANYLTLGILLALLVIEVIALINCATQRADAFPVVGSLSKTGWMAILAGAVIATLVCSFFVTFGISLFAFAAITAAAIYLLDVRPALRDATNGTGSW